MVRTVALVRRTVVRPEGDRPVRPRSDAHSPRRWTTTPTTSRILRGTTRPRSNHDNDLDQPALGQPTAHPTRRLARSSRRRSHRRPARTTRQLLGQHPAEHGDLLRGGVHPGSRGVGCGSTSASVIGSVWSTSSPATTAKMSSPGGRSMSSPRTLRNSGRTAHRDRAGRDRPRRRAAHEPERVAQALVEAAARRRRPPIHADPLSPAAGQNDPEVRRPMPSAPVVVRAARFGAGIPMVLVRCQAFQGAPRASSRRVAASSHSGRLRWRRVSTRCQRSCDPQPPTATHQRLRRTR